MNYEPDKITDAEETLQHWGIKGMKWKKKKKPKETEEQIKAELDRRVNANRKVQQYRYTMNEKDRKLSREQENYAYDRSKQLIPRQKKAASRVSRALEKVKTKTLGKVANAKEKFFKSKLWDGGYNKALGEMNQSRSLEEANRNMWNLNKKAKERKDQEARNAQWVAQRQRKRKADEGGIANPGPRTKKSKKSLYNSMKARGGRRQVE